MITWWAHYVVILSYKLKSTKTLQLHWLVFLCQFITSCNCRVMAQSTSRWVPSPVFVVDNHIYQCAQRSGEFRWIWRQFLRWRAPSLPFDLFTSFLSSLQFFLPMMIAFTPLQSDVLFHLLPGPVRSCLRLQEEWVIWGHPINLKTWTPTTFYFVQLLFQH